jgi:hypothetical protein
LLNELLYEIENHPNIKSVISKKSIKQILPWALKMELFFKLLKIKEPANTKLLLTESESVLAILSISSAKISLA